MPTNPIVTIAALAAVLIAPCASVARAQDATAGPPLQFIFTSDPHFGITRKNFRGGTNVDARVVNAAAVAAMNRIPDLTFPDDGGVSAGRRVKTLEFVAVGGDIANRADPGVPAARDLWHQFIETYESGLTLHRPDGSRTTLFAVPGNHDAYNALGLAKAPSTARDPSSMIGLYNMMVRPLQPMTAKEFNYERDRVHSSRDIGGLHLVFLQIWPDSEERLWLERDLRAVPNGRPVVLFTHDPPDSDPKHFTGPRASAGTPANDKFEAILAETFKDGDAPTQPAVVEARAFAHFVKSHPAIVAYFHGHSNFSELSTWRGPDGDIALNAFRADSPMKGKISAEDETQLSFLVACVDGSAKRMTVREILWNITPSDSATPPRWGAMRTVNLR